MKNALKSDKTQTQLELVFYKLGFSNQPQEIVMLISWIAWVRSLCMTCV